VQDKEVHMVASEATVGPSLAIKQKRHSVKLNIHFHITLAGTPDSMVRVVEMVKEEQDKKTLVVQVVVLFG
jgi:hypothetical protein